MLTYLVKQVLFAPLALILVGLAAFRLLRKRRRAGVVAIALVVTLCSVLSSKLAARGLARLAESVPAVSLSQVKDYDPQCVVVLGSGVEPQAPEYGGRPVPRRESWDRVAYARYLAQEFDLPVLVCGGGATVQESEAAAMADVLHQWGIERVWLEGKSSTTEENAVQGARVLRQHHVTRAIVVTSASHAARAKASFQKVGMEVLVAPTAFYYEGPRERGVLGWLPASQYWESSMESIRALVGELWYQVKG